MSGSLYRSTLTPTRPLVSRGLQTLLKQRTDSGTRHGVPGGKPVAGSATATGAGFGSAKAQAATATATMTFKDGVNMTVNR